MTIAKPIEVEVRVDRNMVVMVVHGYSTLTLPPDAAHAIARELVRASNQCEQPRGPNQTRVIRTN